MRKALALGAAGALAALIGASPVQAQDFGVSVGFGTPGYEAGSGAENGCHPPGRCGAGL